MISTITICLILIAMLVLIWPSGNRKEETEAERLKREYESALSGSDKKAALTAGRLYYASGRKDKALTVYDEQAIANDLSTMPQTVYLEESRNNEITEIEISKPSSSTIINY